MISIVTSTYNRAGLLERLYESLKSQTCPDFEWVIVDDGSSDNTSDVINGFINEEKIKITFLQQENLGKHVAINHALPYCKGSWVVFVDSDDFITTEAIQILKYHATKISDNPDFCGIGALKLTFNNEIVGRHPLTDIVDLPFFDYYHRHKYHGDLVLMFQTELLLQNLFPVFENEKFMPEGVVWETVSRDKLVRFINNPIYFCEYRADGLTARYHELMIQNPLGNALYYKILAEHPHAPFSLKLRATLINQYLLSIASKNGSDISELTPSNKLRPYLFLAKFIMPFYKLKRILDGLSFKF